MLNTNTPAEGIPIADYIAAKYGPAMAAQIGNPNNPLSRTGAAVGIQFTPNRRVVPTLACHALLEMYYTSCRAEAAEDSGAGAADGQDTSSAALAVGNRFMELLMERYFVQGEDVSTTAGGVQDSVLLATGAEAGMPIALLEEFAAGTSAAVLQARDVAARKDAHAKQRMRVNGVPYCILENQKRPKQPLVFSGGQPVDAMAEFLQEAYQP